MKNGNDRSPFTNVFIINPSSNDTVLELTSSTGAATVRYCLLCIIVAMPIFIIINNSAQWTGHRPAALKLIY